MGSMEISSERLAYWFLRLNGFMTIYNFVVHPEQADHAGNYPQQTDVDVMGVRFPHRQENRKRPMADHEVFQNNLLTQLVLAETKSGRCQLNESWRNPSRENMQKVLSAAGILSPDLIEGASTALYKDGHWSNGAIWLRWAAFGDSHNRDLGKRYPAVPQLTWEEQVLPFIYSRFRDYTQEKRMHDQWDADAKGLFRAAINIVSVDEFIGTVRVVNPQG